MLFRIDTPSVVEIYVAWLSFVVLIQAVVEDFDHHYDLLYHGGEFKSRIPKHTMNPFGRHSPLRDQLGISLAAFHALAVVLVDLHVIVAEAGQTSLPLPLRRYRYRRRRRRCRQHHHTTTTTTVTSSTSSISTTHQSPDMVTTATTPPPHAARTHSDPAHRGRHIHRNCPPVAVSAHAARLLRHLRGRPLDARARSHTAARAALRAEPDLCRPDAVFRCVAVSGREAAHAGPTTQWHPHLPCHFRAALHSAVAPILTPCQYSIMRRYAARAPARCSHNAASAVDHALRTSATDGDVGAPHRRKGAIQPYAGVSWHGDCGDRVLQDEHEGRGCGLPSVAGH